MKNNQKVATPTLFMLTPAHFPSETKKSAKISGKIPAGISAEICSLFLHKSKQKAFSRQRLSIVTVNVTKTRKTT
jgi:hypothetical protein